jgi:hypothetical protein
LTKHLFQCRVRLVRSQSREALLENVDFSLPSEVDAFRTELRAWLASNLTEDLLAAARRLGSDDGAFESLRTWNAIMADAGWALPTPTVDLTS